MIITNNSIQLFREQMYAEEKKPGTIECYLHGIRFFAQYIEDKEAITKNTIIEYKHYLKDLNYKEATANVMLSALNHFLELNGYSSCKVKLFKKQKSSFRPSNKELSKTEFLKALDVARKEKNWRLFLLILTLGSTGIRVSELKYIKVEDLKRGFSYVENKGKSRCVVLPKALCIELKSYLQKKGIRSGAIFVTKNGRAIDRRNILRDLKNLANKAGISKDKMFPHNLRHLFAVSFFEKYKDISMLADILGHSNINTTRIYTMQSCERQSEMIEKMGLVAHYINIPQNKHFGVLIDIIQLNAVFILAPSTSVFNT